ncbi:MAG: GatB/YqeY domain-containing protein, partial [Campylobacter concisus]|nr:GatB/YqeY domain-containing protein [Campylobacter concisus]
AKDEFKRDTLRTLNAALKQVEVDQRIEMTDEVVLPLLQKEIKKRADSVELYLKGAREDLAKKEQSEIELIKAYLPAQLSDDELKEKIKSIIEKVGKNLGAVMKMAKDEIGASAEAKRISMIAKELLA